MMRFHLRAGLGTGIALLFVAQISMAASAKYPVTGFIKTGSQGGAGTTPVLVIDSTAAPSTASGTRKVLVLSQACFKVDAGNTVTLTAGEIVVSFAASNSNGGAGCQTFGAGYVIPGGDVYCAATGTANFTCTVSGIVARLY